MCKLSAHLLHHTFWSVFAQHGIVCVAVPRDLEGVWRYTIRQDSEVLWFSSNFAPKIQCTAGQVPVVSLLEDSGAHEADMQYGWQSK